MRAELVPLEMISGLGKKSIDILNKQGLRNVKDLFLAFPYRYEFFEPMNLIEASKNDKACLVGRVITPLKYQYYRAHLSSLTFSMNVNDEIIKVIIFNRQYLAKQLRPGGMVKVSGKYNSYRKELVAAQVFPNVTTAHCEAFYHIKDLSAKAINKSVLKAFEINARLDEYLPKYSLDKYQFLDINEMVYKLHNPQNKYDIKRAILRRKYEEILDFYIRLHHFKNLKEKASRDAIKYDINLVKELIKTIPFELTVDQKECVNTIFKSFKSPYPANRLIQGDVGSGKTIVAVLAAYAMVTAKKQVVIMAPTEILAIQHVEYFKKFLSSFGVNIELFTGSVTKANRTKIINKVKDGTCDILIGTHALYYEDFTYHNLGLAIIDEQHRFGVNARNKLLNNGEAIDALYLSATPIPRTLALTIFSDLDISTIKSVRLTKKPIKTVVLTSENIEKCFQKLDEELKKGHQAYFVTSAIESLEERFDLDDIKSLLLQRFPKLRIAVMHGKLKDNEKQSIMQAFKNKELDVLVSTTVIEVGISIDNATMITIMDSQNFGLAQLHQLRGRVGRGDLDGYCYLVTNNMDTERLKVLEKSNDGFYLAEMDLKLRGPGDYFGMRQSGISEFVFANFDEDMELFKEISKDAGTYYLMAHYDPVVKKYIENVLKTLEFSLNLN